ncbi:hypothetical protein ACFQY0_13680 [Haloferula chungangensis]|uniref:Uncharacterized protein n=1 Tax=Haloferula chungangensis TaxID=1048331 RepID=A0ABW2LAB5_9BACT
MNIRSALIMIGIASLAMPAFGNDQTLKSEEIRVGSMVLAIDAALKSPEKKESLETIARYGTDTRHYVMIRGWLSELLKGTESQLAATTDPELKAKHQQKADFLKKAIRRIDLE